MSRFKWRLQFWLKCYCARVTGNKQQSPMLKSIVLLTPFSEVQGSFIYYPTTQQNANCSLFMLLKKHSYCMVEDEFRSLTVCGEKLLRSLVGVYLCTIDGCQRWSGRLLITCCWAFLSWAVHEPWQFVMFPVRMLSIAPLWKFTRTWRGNLTLFKSLLYVDFVVFVAVFSGLC